MGKPVHGSNLNPSSNYLFSSPLVFGPPETLGMSTNQEGQPCSVLSLRVAGCGFHLPSTTHTGNHHHIESGWNVHLCFTDLCSFPELRKWPSFNVKNANFLRGGQWQCFTWEHTWMCDSMYKKWLLGVGVDASGVQRFHVGRLLPLPLYAAA